MADVNVNIFTATRQRGGVSVPRSGVIVGDPLPNPVNPPSGTFVQSVSGDWVDNTDPFNPIVQYQEAEERASNTVLFDKNYIIGNAGARTGNILFDFTGAKRGAWTEMRHNDASAFTFPTEAMLMFDTADISTTVDNYFLFVITDKTGSSEVVKVFHALEGGI